MLSCPRIYSLINFCLKIKKEKCKEVKNNEGGNSNMCESRVLIEKEGERELLMEDVVHVEVDGEDIKLMGILGETQNAKGRIKEINLMKHTIVIEIV
jgi:predicted RNA-binding protein